MTAFLRIEEGTLLNLERAGHVIATGGSAVYSEAAMAKLACEGVIAHLHLPLPDLTARLADLDERGVVRAPGQTLNDLYAERQPLYERYRDFTVDCSGKGYQEVVDLAAARFQALKRGAPGLNGE
jgi:shikimate kinase